VGVFFFIIIQPNPIKLGEKIRMAHAWSNFFSFLCDLENLCFYGFFLCLLRSFRFGFWFWVWCSCWVQQVEGRHVDRRSVLSFGTAIPLHPTSLSAVESIYFVCFLRLFLIYFNGVVLILDFVGR